MEHKSPDWLTPEFLEKCFEKTDKYNGINIVKVTTSPAVPFGNNYGSTVLRVNLDYKRKEREEIYKLSLIIKAPLTEGYMMDMIDNTDCEPLFYYTFLDKAYQIISHHFAPDCYPSISPTVVILEDLKDKGFIMADRTKQLDFEHCKLYVKAAASFHAVSYAVCNENAEFIKAFKRTNMFSNESHIGPVMKNVLKYGLQCVSAHVNNKKHSKILLSDIDTIWDMLVDSQKPREKFNCLRQGDPWTTNMMFKYDEGGNVYDIKLLDFQNLTYGSPIYDLVFFIWSSANPDVRKFRLNDLYQLYFEIFNQNLEEMGYTDKLCYNDFTEDIKRFNPLALWILGVIPCSINPIAADYNLLFSKLDPSKGELSENPFEEFYTVSHCHDVLPQYMEHLERAGVFDYIESIVNK